MITLPTQGLLKSPYLIDDDSYSWCPGQVEIASMPFFCPRVHELWLDDGYVGLLEKVTELPLKEVMVGWRHSDAKLK